MTWSQVKAKERQAGVLFVLETLCDFSLQTVCRVVTKRLTRLVWLQVLFVVFTGSGECLWC